MDVISQASTARGSLGDIVGRADGRRRVRSALASATAALWVGLPMAVAAAGVWRMSAHAAALVVAGACIVASVAMGVALGWPRADERAAAAELDRAYGLDASLETAVEIRDGALGGPLAGAVMRQAEASAASVDPAAIPLEPGGRARYLVVPAALLAALVALPEGPSWRATGSAAAVATGEGALAPEQQTAAGQPVGPNEGYAAVRVSRAEIARSLKAAAEADEAAERARRGLRPPKATERGANRARVASHADDRGDDEAGRRRGDGADPDRGVPSGGAAAVAGEIDVREEAIVREHFPEYADVIRRYFAGGGRNAADGGVR